MAKQVKPNLQPSNVSLQILDSREDFKSVIDENADELKLQDFSQLMPDLDFSKIKFVHSKVADYILEMADKMIAHMLKELGPDQHKPSIPGLLEMFDATFKIEDKNAKKQRNRDLKNYIPTLKEIELNAASPSPMTELLKAKHEFEQNSHKNKNAFMLGSIKVGSTIATARVNWDFAVQTYKETRENAEATFQESVNTAYVNEIDQVDTRSPNLANEILMHQTSFEYATAIAKAMDAYGKEISKANAALSTAFATLSNELVKQWNTMAQDETTLILANRTDSYKLWTAIKTAFNKLFSGNRKI